MHFSIHSLLQAHSASTTWSTVNRIWRHSIRIWHSTKRPATFWTRRTTAIITTTTTIRIPNLLKVNLVSLSLSLIKLYAVSSRSLSLSLLTFLVMSISLNMCNILFSATKDMSVKLSRLIFFSFIRQVAPIAMHVQQTLKRISTCEKD